MILEVVESGHDADDFADIDVERCKIINEIGMDAGEWIKNGLRFLIDGVVVKRNGDSFTKVEVAFWENGVAFL